MNQDVSKLSDEQRIELIAQHYKEILTLVGEDPGRQGLIKTPMRAAKALWHITSGYRSDAHDTLTSALFDHEGSKVVIVRDIEFYSMCEHHILPFYGSVSIAYIPGNKIVGISKLARTVDICARKLQVQERLTAEIAEAVSYALDARGVLVLCRAQHLCMKMRGVEKQDSTTTTLEYNGAFADDDMLRRDTIDALKN